MSDYIETPAEIYKRSLERLEKAASEVNRLGAVSGPQWPKLTDALISARVALASVRSPTKSQEQIERLIAAHRITDPAHPHDCECHPCWLTKELG